MVDISWTDSCILLGDIGGIQMKKIKLDYEVVEVKKRGFWKCLYEPYNRYEVTVKLANGEVYVFNVSFDGCDSMTHNEHIEWHLKDAIEHRHPRGPKGVKTHGTVEASK